MDNACAFKPLDFMSALSIALTTDDDRMFTLFARETAKFALSHSDKEKYLWPYHQTVGLANGKDRLGHFGMAQNHGAGFATAAQILQIHRLAGGHSSALPVLAGLSTLFNASLPCPNADSNYDVLVPNDFAMAFHPRRPLLVAGADRTTMRSWDLESLSEAGAWQAHTDEIHSCAFDPTGERLVSASYDQTVRLWDTRRRRLLMALTGFGETKVFAVDWSDDGRHIAAALGDGSIMLWSVPDRE